MPVRVASDHDLENAGAPGSESRTAEEPCGCVLVIVRELMGSELAACSGEIGKGGGEKNHDVLSHVTRGRSSCCFFFDDETEYSCWFPGGMA